MNSRKRMMALLASVALAGSLAGCAGYSTLTGRPAGFLYADVRGPVMATESERGSKMGFATARSILGLVAMGDCSVTAAAKSADIIKIKSIDYEVKNYCVFAQITTIVTGD